MKPPPSRSASPSVELGVADAGQDVVGRSAGSVAFGLALGLEVQDRARERADAFVFGAHVMFLRARSADGGPHRRRAAYFVMLELIRGGSHLKKYTFGLPSAFGGAPKVQRVREGREHDLAQRVAGRRERAVVEGGAGLLQDGLEQGHLLAGQRRGHELVGLALRDRRGRLDDQAGLALDVHARLGRPAEGQSGVGRPERTPRDGVVRGPRSRCPCCR